MDANIVHTLLPDRLSKNIDYFAGRTWLLPYLVDWFDKSDDDRFFILQGAPGTGKSMIMAWLAGAGPLHTSLGDEQSRMSLERIRPLVKGVHFCVANTGSISPKTMAENLASQLTQQVEGFGDALAATLSNRVQLTANIIDSNAGNSITGIYVKDLNLGGLDEDTSFNLAFRDPLKKLYELGYYDQPMIILVDALDESLTYTGQKKIVEILAGLSDIPKKVRFIVATRPDPAVLVHFQDGKPFDIVKKAPQTIDDDIYLYVLERIRTCDSFMNGKINSATAERLAKKISESAKAVFLYAHLLFENILPTLPDIPTFIENDLPAGLGGLYNIFLNREIGTNEEKWHNESKPLLGLICVAQGKGLTKNQLSNIIGHDIEYPLSIWTQYLEGPFPDGPFRVFHKSFSDFLLEDKKENRNRRINAVEMHKKIIDYYWTIILEYQQLKKSDGNHSRNVLADWKLLGRDGIDANNSYFYLLYHLAEHLAFLLEKTPTNYEGINMLYDLARNKDFANAQLEYAGDIDLPLKTIRFALSTAANSNDAPRMAEFILRHAKAVSLLTEISPLDILRSEKKIVHALKLADLHEQMIMIAWYLLLAWELKDAGKIDDARLILGELAGKGLKTQYHPLFIPLLIQVSEIDCDVWSNIVKALLDDDGRYKLAYSMIDCGRFDQAVGIASSFQYPENCANILIDIGLGCRQANKAGDLLPKMRKVLSDAKCYVNTIDSDSKKAFMLSEVAIAQAQVGLTDEALKTIYEALKISRIGSDVGYFHFTWHEVMFNLAIAQAQVGLRAEAHKTIAEALGTIDTVDETHPRRHYVLCQLALAQYDTGLTCDARKTINKALNAVNKIYNNNEKSAALCWIARVLARIKEFRGAIEFARKLDDNYDKSRALLNIALVQAEMSLQGDARSTFSLAIDVTKAIYDEYGRHSRLLELIAALIQIRSIEESNTLFEEALAIARSIEPETIRSDVLAAVSANIQTREARVVRKEIEATLKFEAMARGVNVEYETDLALHRIASALAGTRNFDGAMAAANRLNDIYRQKIPVLMEVAVSQALAGLKDEARKTIDDALRLGRSLSDEQMSNALRTISVSVTRLGDFDAAINIANDIKLRYVRAEALSDIAVSQALGGLKDEASTTLGAIKVILQDTKETETRAKILEDVAIAQARTGFLRDAMLSAGAITEVRSRNKVIAGIVKASLRSNPAPQEVIEIAEQIMGDRFTKCMVLADIAIAQALAGLKDEAHVMIRKVLRIIERMQYRWLPLARIAIAQALAGLKDEAQKTFDDAIKDLVHHGSYYANGVSLYLGDISETITRLQPLDVRSAMEAARAIPEEQYRSEAISNIVKALLKARPARIELAIELAKEISEDYAQLGILREIARTRIDAGEFQKAYDAIDTAIKVRKLDLKKVLEVFEDVQRIDREHLRNFLIPCAYRIHLAVRICALLILNYPYDGKRMSEVLIEFLPSSEEIRIGEVSPGEVRPNIR